MRSNMQPEFNEFLAKDPFQADMQAGGVGAGYGGLVYPVRGLPRQ